MKSPATAVWLFLSFLHLICWVFVFAFLVVRLLLGRGELAANLGFFVPAICGAVAAVLIYDRFSRRLS